MSTPLVKSKVREPTMTCPYSNTLLILTSYADNNTVIAQYNGIGFSFPLGLDDAKRLFAETAVYKIEERLVDPVHTTKYLEQKVQSYDPPHAAATEYRLFQPKLKIGPPIHAKKSRDVTDSTSTGHKRKRDVSDTTRQDSPEVQVDSRSVSNI